MSLTATALLIIFGPERVTRFFKQALLLIQELLEYVDEIKRRVSHEHEPVVFYHPVSDSKWLNYFGAFYITALVLLLLVLFLIIAR